jgi:multiple sugar transport system substrate-binding protein
MAHDVFISYSSKDKPIADAICASLEGAGIRCWIAPRDIGAGEDWPTSIAKAIPASRLMVLIFSSHSNSSEDVGRELYLAANSKLVIIPFKIEDVAPEPGKQYYLARTHWLDAMNPPTREQIQNLVDRVRVFIPVVGTERVETRVSAAQPPQGTLPPSAALHPAAKKQPKSPVSRKVRPAVFIWSAIGLVVLAMAYLISPLSGLTLFPKSAKPPATPTASITGTATSIPPTIPSEPVQIRWFVGLGTGSDPGQVDIEQEVVDDFNASHSNIKLVMQIIPLENSADVLAAQIASAAGPDVIGPLSWGEANDFNDQLMDLTPYMDQVDRSLFNPLHLAMYQTGSVMVSLPFIVHPSMVYYNPALFDAAGLSYPPSNYGDAYVMKDWGEVPWDWNALAHVARFLTLDSNGRNANSVNFNPNTIQQYGFDWVWMNPPQFIGTYFSAGSMLEGAPGSYRASSPSAWKDAWQWTQDGIFSSQPFIPNLAVANSPEFGGGNTFSSGRVAMTVLPNWYLCCLMDFTNAGNTFQVGILPSYNNRVHGRMDNQSFRIWKGTSHPDEAFEVLYWLTTVGIDKLVVGNGDIAPAYVGLPAIASRQQPFINANAGKYPFVTQQSWNVMLGGLNYPDVPSAEAYMPNVTEAKERLATFGDLLRSDVSIDLTNEIATLENDLTTIFNK